MSVVLRLSTATEVSKKPVDPSAKYRTCRPTGCRRAANSCALVRPSPSGSPLASLGSFGFSPKNVSHASGIVSPSVSVSCAPAARPAACSSTEVSDGVALAHTRAATRASSDRPEVHAPARRLVCDVQVVQAWASEVAKRAACLMDGSISRRKATGWCQAGPARHGDGRVRNGPDSRRTYRPFAGLHEVTHELASPPGNASNFTRPGRRDVSWCGRRYERRGRTGREGATRSACGRTHVEACVTT